VAFQYDTGFDVTIIDKVEWIRIGSPKLTASDKIVHVGGSKLRIIDKFHCTIREFDREDKIYIYVASSNTVNLFGLNAIDELNLWSVM